MRKDVHLPQNCWERMDVYYYTATTNALELEHQAISIHSVDQKCIPLDLVQKTILRS